MTAMTTTEAERQRKQKELDSILDAALDELDDDSDSEDDVEDRHADRRNARSDIRQKQNAATANDVDVDAPIGVDARIGVPYSREYLANNPSLEDRGSNNNNNNNNNNAPSQNRPRFGPEPPPPSSSLSPPFDTSQLPPLPPLDLPPEDAEELAASLEGMMKQFTEQLGGGFDGGGFDGDFGGMAGLDDMFKKMMEAEGAAVGGIGGDASPHRAATANGSDETPRAHGRNDSDDTSASSTPSTTSNNNKSKTNKPTPRKNNNVPKEPNVDESINRLLDGINSAANQPLPSANLPNPTNNDAADLNMDPSQFEKMGEQMMENIMSQFDAMGNANDGNGIVDGVMKQLLNRDLMYEPMKEVCVRFPSYLARNREELSESEYERYGTQYAYFQKIVRVYETEPENFDRLMELMQEVQEYGQPPVDIIRDLAPELEFDGEGMPVMNPMGGGMMGGGMPGMPGMGAFPGGAGGNEQCCIS